MITDEDGLEGWCMEVIWVVVSGEGKMEDA